ncbi:hypothetical protein HK097_000672, partial [Rhizophlyctis rosea]
MSRQLEVEEEEDAPLSNIPAGRSAGAGPAAPAKTGDDDSPLNTIAGRKFPDDDDDVPLSTVSASASPSIGK